MFENLAEETSARGKFVHFMCTPQDVEKTSQVELQR